MRKPRLNLRQRGSRKNDLILFDVVFHDDKSVEAEAFFHASAIFNVKRVYTDPETKKKYRIFMVPESSRHKNRAHFSYEKIALKEI